MGYGDTRLNPETFFARIATDADYDAITVTPASFSKYGQSIIKSANMHMSPFFR
jgi:hypothetical protein